MNITRAADELGARFRPWQEFGVINECKIGLEMLYDHKYCNTLKRNSRVKPFVFNTGISMEFHQLKIINLTSSENC